MRLIGTVVLLVLLLITSFLTPVGLAANSDALQPIPASQLFEVHCAGCHAQGGNIIRRGKNLKLKALQRYEMDSAAAISQIVTQGKGNMSAYEARLTPEEIQVLASYVLEQAHQDWKLKPG